LETFLGYLLLFKLINCDNNDSEQSSRNNINSKIKIGMYNTLSDVEDDDLKGRNKYNSLKFRKENVEFKKDKSKLREDNIKKSNTNKINHQEEEENLKTSNLN